MQLGWGQLLVIILLLFFLFGNLPKLIQDSSTALQELLQKTKKEKPKTRKKKTDQ
jgi:Sec-independent protein translocase protein TatA